MTINEKDLKYNLQQLSEQEKKNLQNNPELRQFIIDWKELIQKEKEIRNQKEEIRIKMLKLMISLTPNYFNLNLKLRFSDLNYQLYFLKNFPDEYAKIKLYPIVRR